jgi:hypothetical protein
MISTVQRDILMRLEEICELSEDVRFGQVVDFMGFLGQDATNQNLAVIEDEQFLAVLDRYKADLQRRSKAAGLAA